MTAATLRGQSSHSLPTLGKQVGISEAGVCSATMQILLLLLRPEVMFWQLS